MTKSMPTWMFTRRELLGAGAGAVGAAALLAGGLSLVRRSFGAPPGDAGAGYFPNCTVYTHDGRALRFYDDLVRGKVVGLNMMYAKCSGICPRMTTNLLDVQAALGGHLGSDIFLVSITLQPADDSPEVLARYVERQRQRPRWPFITGDPDDIELIRRRLGFYDPDPAVDQDKRQHTGMVRIGNDALRRWTMVPALAKPDQIAGTLLRIRSTTSAAVVAAART